MDWEDILNEFLEGGVLRADVEALRWRIQLPVEGRVVVDRELQLVDDLGVAGAAMVSGVVMENAVRRVGEALGRERQVNAPGHWRWEKGVPTAGRSEPGDATGDAELAGELRELGRSMPIEEAALERLLKRIREIELTGDLRGRAQGGGDTMRLNPGEDELKLDALAASKDVLPARADSDETETPGC